MLQLRPMPTVWPSILRANVELAPKEDSPRGALPDSGCGRRRTERHQLPHRRHQHLHLKPVRRDRRVVWHDRCQLVERRGARRRPGPVGLGERLQHLRRPIGDALRVAHELVDERP